MDLLRVDHVTESFIVSGGTLAKIRLAIAAFQIGFLIHRVQVDSQIKVCNVGGACVPFSGAYIFSTFTVWCWATQAVYFLLAGLASAAGERVARYRIFLFSLWVLYQIMFAMALLVTITVWCVLVPHLHLGKWLGIEEAGQGLAIMYSAFGYTTHILNLVFMFAELSLNRLPFQHQHIVFCITWGQLYLLFSWIFHSKTGVWFYFFLDYEPSYALVPYVLLTSVLFFYYRFGEWCSEHLKHRIRVSQQSEKTADIQEPSATKPKKLAKRMETLSTIIYLADDDSYAFQAWSCCTNLYKKLSSILPAPLAHGKAE